jgi:hypothetical protein
MAGLVPALPIKDVLPFLNEITGPGDDGFGSGMRRRRDGLDAKAR